MRSEAGRRSSFTLIEMLLVMIVISIMAGMLFKLMVLANNQSLKADSIAELEAIAMALNEFRSEYGMYPGGTNIRYEYESTNYQNPAFVSYLYSNPGYPPSPTPGIKLFDYGLVSYLWPREDDNITISHKGNHTWEPDTKRDEAAKKRWAPFLSIVRTKVDYIGRNGTAVCTFQAPYSNAYKTVWDPWDNEIKYKCLAPYQTYELWSMGPDEVNGTKDDIHKTSWDN